MGAMAHPLLVAICVICCIGFLYRLVSRGSARCFQSLAGKHVLVTDSCQSALLAIAKRSLQEGGYVTLLSHNEAALSTTHQALLEDNEAWSPRIFSKIADTRDPVAAANAVESSFKWRPIDILVYSYGSINMGLFEIKLEEIEKYISSNIMAAVYVVHAAIPLMKHRSSAENRSAIVLISPVSGLNVLRGARVDSITQYALKGLAELLRFELLQHNVGIHFVCPGSAAKSVLSNQGKIWKEDKASAKIADKLANSILEAVKKGHFLVTTGIDGFLVGVLARGCIPADSWARMFLEFVLLVPLRFLSMVMNNSIFKKNSRRATFH